MRPDVHRELEKLVGEIGALVHRLRAHDQPLARQLLEMAVLEIRSRMHGIADDELQALADDLAGHTSPVSIDNEQDDNPARIMPSPRVVVALGDINRGKRKRRN
jgi:hypothetical protein